MKTASDPDLLKALDRETDNAQRWAGDLECIMQRLGVSCPLVNDARATVEARLEALAADLLASADFEPMTAQGAVMRRVAAVLARSSAS